MSPENVPRTPTNRVSVLVGRDREAMTWSVAAGARPPDQAQPASSVLSDLTATAKPAAYMIDDSLDSLVADVFAVVVAHAPVRVSQDQVDRGVVPQFVGNCRENVPTNVEPGRRFDPDFL